MTARPTKYTILLKNALEELGIKVLVEKNDGHKHIDLCIPAAKINVEIDGSQHLTDAYQIIRDLSRGHFSSKDGFNTIHIPNTAIKENLGGIASALAEASKIIEEKLHTKKSGKNQLVVINGGSPFNSYDQYLQFLKSIEIDFSRYLGERKYWKSHLRKDLENDFEVVMTEMPSKMNAKYIEWEIWFQKIIPYLRDNVVLLGHSLGGIFLIKYLNENPFPVKISAIFLLAAPFNDEALEPLGDFKLAQDLSKITELTNKIYLYQSEDDPIVHPSEVYKYQKAFPNATLRLFKDKGHFHKLEEFPEIIEDLKSCAK